MHINFNKLVNKTAGLEAGQRPKAGLSQQAMLIVAQAVATQAMQGAITAGQGHQPNATARSRSASTRYKMVAHKVQCHRIPKK